MMEIRVATKDDIDCLMSIRLEMLTVVNNLPENYEHSDEVINESRDYFLNGDQMTVLASDGDKVIGCASMSFIRIMPTFAHPTGKRAHLMNVYTRGEYRRQGIARKMVEMLIEKTWDYPIPYELLKTSDYIVLANKTHLLDENYDLKVTWFSAKYNSDTNMLEYLSIEGYLLGK